MISDAISVGPRDGEFSIEEFIPSSEFRFEVPNKASSSMKMASVVSTGIVCGTVGGIEVGALEGVF